MRREARREVMIRKKDEKQRDRDERKKKGSER